MLPDAELQRLTEWRDKEADDWIKACRKEEPAISELVSRFIAYGGYRASMSTRLIVAQEMLAEYLQRGEV